MILYAVLGYALAFHGFSAQAKECGANLESDNGTLEIEPSAWPCLWVISLQNRTGLRLELSPSMEEPTLVIPEQKNFSNLDHVESFWIKGSEKVSHTFKGKVLAVLVPSHYEKIILNWTGLTVGHSPVTSSRKFINTSEGSLDWEHKTDGTDKVFWAFDHRTHGNLKWTLDTVLPACDVEDPCDSISFAVVQIMLDGNISIIEKAWTCEGSSEGSLNLSDTSKVLLILDINSVVAARTNLQVTWRQNQESDPSPTNEFVWNGTIVALKGEDVEILCDIHGIPLPKIRWTRENGPLNSHRMVVVNNGKVLRIKNAQLYDENSYFCVAANGVGPPATQSVRLQVYNPSQECHGIIESDKGNLTMKSLSHSCIWLIKLQNTTGFRVELNPHMTEPISFISEPNSSNSNVQSIQLTGSKNASHVFEGQSLAILVPPGRERTTLSWTGLDVVDSGVSSSIKFVHDLKGTLEWDSQLDGTEKIFWAIDVELNGELNWTLNTASSTARDQDSLCEIISFSVLQIKPDGTIREVQRTCDDSSEGSLKLEISSQVLILLHMKSLGTSRSKLEVSWTHNNEPLEKNVDGILGGTCGAGVILIPFNSGQTNVTPSACINGLTFDWNSRRIYYSYDGRIRRSNLNGSESEILLSDTPPTLRVMTIEPASGNLYYLNQTSRTIGVCDNDAKKCSTIVNNVSSVWDFAVHLSKGLLFWSTRGNIVRANLDGSNAIVLLEGYVHGLDVDEHDDRLYWGFDEGIGSCDMKGQHIRKLPKPNITGPVNDVAIDNDKVYIGGYRSNGIRVTSKLGKNSRKLADAQFKGDFFLIAFFGTRVSNRPGNPCAEAKCAHLCVLVTRWTYRCTCPDGQVLNADGKTCHM